MIYSKEKIQANIKASEASDLAYANWYVNLPDEKKAQMIKSGYDFVVNRIRQSVIAENPFATEEDVKRRFIEVTQREDYSAETFEFILKTLEKRKEKEWQERFKRMKKELGWSYDEITTFIEAKNGDTVKSSINRKLPAFAKLAVCVFEQSQKTK